MAMVRFSRLKVIPEGGARVKVIDGVPIMVARYNGELRAYIAVCPHKGYVMCERSVNGGKLVCPGHGEVFDFSTGEPSKGKAKEPLPRLHLEVREEERGSEVWVELPGDEHREWIRRVSKPIH